LDQSTRWSQPLEAHSETKARSCPRAKSRVPMDAQTWSRLVLKHLLSEVYNFEWFWRIQHKHLAGANLGVVGCLCLAHLLQWSCSSPLLSLDVLWKPKRLIHWNRGRYYPMKVYGVWMEQIKICWYLAGCLLHPFRWNIETMLCVAVAQPTMAWERPMSTRFIGPGPGCDGSSSTTILRYGTRIDTAPCET